VKPTILSDQAALREDRARADFPVDSILRALQNGQRVLFDGMQESTTRLGLSSETALQANARIVRAQFARNCPRVKLSYVVPRLPIVLRGSKRGAKYYTRVTGLN
jgi:hypothetical protein